MNVVGMRWIAIESYPKISLVPNTTDRDNIGNCCVYNGCSVKIINATQYNGHVGVAERPVHKNSDRWYVRIDELKQFVEMDAGDLNVMDDGDAAVLAMNMQQMCLLTDS